MSSPLKTRLALEALEAREVPASLVFTNEGGTGLMETVANWRDRDTYQPVLAAPVQNDSLTFDGTRSNEPLTNLHGFALPDTIADFASIQFINNYSGTVTLASELNPSPTNKGIATTTFTLSAAPIGAIKQQAPNTDLSVLGNFTWTGGILNSTPSNANVNLYGGGAITLPGVGNTITTGSTLNFDSLGGTPWTTIAGVGRLLLNGTSEDAIFVRGQSGVRRIVTGLDDANIDGVGGKLNLVSGSWVYEGSGRESTSLRVINSGGLFKVSTQCFIYLRGGSDTPIPLPSYRTTDSASALLHIEEDGRLGTGHGVELNGGSIYIINVPQEYDAAVIYGNLTMNKGDIIASGGETVDGNPVFTRFLVDGNVKWNGGTYRPSIYTTTTGQHLSDVWWVSGTMTVDASKTVKPRIEAIYPAGQQPNGTWYVIQTTATGKLQGDDPLPLAGWTLVTDTVDGIKKKWGIKK